MSFLDPIATIVLPLLAALGLSIGLTAHLCGAKARLRILDHPNERSLHQTPVSRTGGLAILTGIGAALLVIVVLGHFPEGLNRALVGAAMVALISFFDDRAGIGVAPRFAVHMLAAMVAVFSGLALREVEIGFWGWDWPDFLGTGFSLLFLIWMANLYNFMDGMDGFAGGMGLFGFGFLGLLGWLAGNLGFALICWSTALACLGFLGFNFPPARIFMGDTGASTLGFWSGALILWADRHELFPFWAGVLIFSPFIVDATVTLLRRLLAGEKIWQAHRSHYYQRLVQLGWGHRRTVLAEYVLMLAAGCSALGLWLTGKSILVGTGLAGWAAVYAALALIIGRWDKNAHSMR